MLTIGTPTNFVHKSQMTHNEAVRAVDRKAPEPENPTLGADGGNERTNCRCGDDDGFTTISAAGRHFLF
jgi:hypothetical protein